MTFGKLSLLGLPALGLMVLVAPMSGTSITGQANIAGGVTVSATSITFVSTFSAIPGSAFENGSYSGLTGGVFNTTTLSGGPQTGSVPISDFISFTTGLATPINFDLQTILPGTGTVANCSNGSGNPCTPSGSPFTLIQSSTGVTVDLAFLGVAYTGTLASGSTPTQSLFTTQILLTTCSTTAACLSLLAGGGSIAASYSATFSGSVPEPSSILLMGLGLIGAGSFARLKFRKP